MMLFIVPLLYIFLLTFVVVVSSLSYHDYVPKTTTTTTTTTSLMSHVVTTVNPKVLSSSRILLRHNINYKQFRHWRHNYNIENGNDNHLHHYERNQIYCYSFNNDHYYSTLKNTISINMITTKMSLTHNKLLPSTEKFLLPTQQSIYKKLISMFVTILTCFVIIITNPITVDATTTTSSHSFENDIIDTTTITIVNNNNNHDYYNNNIMTMIMTMMMEFQSPTIDRPQIPLVPSLIEQQQQQQNTKGMGGRLIQSITTKQPSLSNNDVISSSPATTIEGLLYLKKPQLRRPSPATDTIIITVIPRNPSTIGLNEPSLLSSIDDATTTTRTMNNNDINNNIIIAGARIPVSKISSFPFRFILNEKNAIISLSKYQQLSYNNDFTINAIVCSTKTNMNSIDNTNNSNKKLNKGRDGNDKNYNDINICQRFMMNEVDENIISNDNNDITMTTSNIVQPTMKGTGISKLLRLRRATTTTTSNENNSNSISTSTGMIRNDDDFVIRAPVSVAIDNTQ